MGDALDFLFSSRTMERVFDPTIADLRHEVFEALAQGRALKAKWIHVKYAWILAATALAQMPVSLAKVFLTIWRLKGG